MNRMAHLRLGIAGLERLLFKIYEYKGFLIYVDEGAKHTL